MNAIYVNFFNSFTLSLDGEQLLKWRSRGSKTVALLQYLLYHNGKTFGREHLCEILYSNDEELEDEGNTFRVTVHRLRKTLVQAGLPEDKTYIISKSGMCGWNEEIEVVSDTDLFYKALEKAAKAKNNDAVLENKIEAFNMYKGEFLPDYTADEWVAVESTKLKNEYLKCVEDIAFYLEKNNNFAKLYEIATQAGNIYPYDEAFQRIRMKALLQLKRPKEALDIYENVTERYFTELGIRPGEQFTELRAEISRDIPANNMSLDEIKAALDEPSLASGAFYCDYLTFVKSYQFAHRMIERTGQSAYIMLCTIVDMDGKSVASEARHAAASDAVSVSIQRALRRGDMYTCVNPGQYLLLLIGINQENCAIVSGRIDNYFRGDYNGRGIRIKFKFMPASTIAQSISSDYSSPIW